MSKSRKERQEKARKRQQRQQMLKWLIPAIAVAIIAVVGILLVVTNGDDNDSNNDNSVDPVLISPDEYRSQFIETDHFLLDVRTPEEYEEGHLNGAVNIDHSEVARRLDEIPRDKPIVVYCRSDNRSGQAARVLVDNGFTEVYDIDGGLVAWNTTLDN